MVLISFRNKECAVEFMTRKRDFWSKYFLDVELWTGQPLQIGRVVRSRIFDTPISVRSAKLIARIGSLFGRLVEEPDFSWNDMNGADISCLILCKNHGKIDELVEVNWGNRKVEVWVTEEYTNWSPEFVSGLPGSDGGRHSTPENMEEGEFRPSGEGLQSTNRDQMHGELGEGVTSPREASKFNAGFKF